MKLFYVFLLIYPFFFSVLPQSPRTLPESSYTLCTTGTVIVNYRSRFNLELTEHAFSGNSCESLQINDSDHTFCVSPDGVIWSTISQKFLGLSFCNNTYVLSSSSTFDSTSHFWNFTTERTGFESITQYKPDVNITFALSQNSSDKGAGAPHAIPVAALVYSESDVTQHWCFKQIIRASAVTASVCKVTIESVLTANYFMRVGWSPGVNLQYTAYIFEYWRLQGTGLYPSSGNQLYCIKSDFFSIFLSFDGTNCTSYIASGCGSTTTVPTCGINEYFFILINSDGTLKIQSWAYPNTALRLDATSMTGFSSPGGGTVNGQLISDTSAYEKIYIHNIP